MFFHKEPTYVLHVFCIQATSPPPLPPFPPFPFPKANPPLIPPKLTKIPQGYYYRIPRTHTFDTRGREREGEREKKRERERERERERCWKINQPYYLQVHICELLVTWSLATNKVNICIPLLPSSFISYVRPVIPALQFGSATSALSSQLSSIHKRYCLYNIYLFL